MRVQHAAQTAKGWPHDTPTEARDAARLADVVEHVRWRLWHGQVQRALDLIGDDSRSYHVVVLDRVLPDMPGDEVAFEIEALRPDVAIVLTSGRVRTGRPCYDAWLEKPYGADELVRKVLKALAVAWRRCDRARRAEAQPVTSFR